MIKKTVNYTDIIKNGNNYDEIEKEEIVRFVFTLPAIKLYEQKTGNRFFEDYSKAWGTFMKAIKNINIHKIEELTLEEQLKIVPILYDQIINEFMMGIVPCLYAEIHDGKYVQNDETVDIAENSLWLMELININFFTEIFKEISANQSKMPNNQTNNKSKKLNALEFYRTIFILKLDVNWCEQQHLNYLVRVFESVSHSLEGNKPRKLTAAELLNVMV